MPATVAAPEPKDIPVPVPAQEEVTFYAPDAPGINVVVADPDATPAQHSYWSAWKAVVPFRGDTLTTADPDVIATVRRGVARGKYFEANLPAGAGPVCDFCGKEIRHLKAYARHVRRHVVEA